MTKKEEKPKVEPRYKEYKDPHRYEFLADNEAQSLGFFDLVAESFLTKTLKDLKESTDTTE